MIEFKKVNCKKKFLVRGVFERGFHAIAPSWKIYMGEFSVNEITFSGILR